ncbi:arginine--tRNA ligase [Candidatus Berkelbacteria bacterium RBG_13_40_8]|uniref:Arginine--tRNA ligase n=1 Tax=Candidatus Berkelbacteria bacterium RBG_13_40_8 TaxID=1797467 RepID=A0A1F5DNL2_9BACT|nr:MAG: arginine--tRNA ligase [Candidatus Berkelbacteria bacterium RBG_13_40_8]
MQNQIKKILIDAVKKAYPEINIPEFSVEKTDAKFGDYSSNVALILKKVTGEKPQKIALIIIKNIEKNNLIEDASMADPGFINFKIALPYWQQKISEIVGKGGSYGHSDLGQDLQVNIEFISANPTGPLTLGNGRGGYFGDVLANVFKAYGAEVEREYYINDRGVQILALGHSVLKDDKAVYKGKYIDEITPRIKSKKMDEVGSEAATILMEEYIKKTIKEMGIEFNTWFSEKSLHEGRTVSEILEMFKKADLTYESEGALWLKTTNYFDDKDRVLVTKKGEHTYFLSDIAYHFDKIRRGYDLLIDFWGADHHGYVGRMNAAIDILKKEQNWSGELKILISQLVRLVSKGREVKMSKREGTYVTLDELIDEVGPDVTRFFFLERSLDTHMDFDLDLAKEHSQKNPIYYVQYAYARIASILQKIRNQKSEIRNNDQILKLLKEPEEKALIKQLIKLPELVEEIVGDYQVQKLPTYATELADSFHRFYEKCPVIKSGSDELTSARLELLKATQIVLKNTLDLMGINAPEKM